MKTRTGFTVLEFLVIITIIAVLAGLLLPALAAARKRMAESKALESAVATEFSLPTTLEELTKKSPTFWTRRYVIGDLEAETKTVELCASMRSTVEGLAVESRAKVRVRLDEASFAFIAAHKDLGLAEIVLLWHAEQNAKNK